MKTDHQKYLDKIITPEFIAKAKEAEEKRFQSVIDAIQNESEEFLEKLKNYIDEFLAECYNSE